MNAADSSIEYDAIIVGSGAGGSAAAHALAKQGLNILLLEKGGDLARDGSTLDFKRVVNQGEFKSKEGWRDGKGRQIVPEEYFNIGGKTKWYGAALLRYGAHEFNVDAGHQCLGWPFSYEELQPYYEQAEQMLRVREFDCERDLEKILRRMARGDNGWMSVPLPLGLQARILQDPLEAMHFDGFASKSDLKSDAETAFLSQVRNLPNTTVLTNATVLELVADSNDLRRIAGVRLKDGRSFRGRTVLLAAGALHSPRLLQSYLQASGLGAELACTSQVGRNLKLHLLTAVVAVSASLKTDLIRKTRLMLNTHLPHSSVQPLGFDAELIATLIPKVVPVPIASQVGRRAYGFFLQTEDGSHQDNRVQQHGASEATMDYDASRLPAAEREHHQLVSRLRNSLLRAGLIPFSKRIGIEGTAHACGTLATGIDPARSVVDAQGKVHGMQSLYVVDGSILPRSSRVNPSLTIYAWSLRVAEKLGAQLRASVTAVREAALT